jgi:hypothetical protein
MVIAFESQSYQRPKAGLLHDSRFLFQDFCDAIFKQSPAHLEANCSPSLLRTTYDLHDQPARRTRPILT